MHRPARLGGAEIRRVAGALRIEHVGAADPERWFAIGQPPADAAKARADLAALLRGAQHVRLVALEGEQVVARIPARRDPGGRFTMWWPTFRARLSGARRAEAAHALAHTCVELADGEGYRYVETKPADDVPDLPLWLAVLAREAFAFTAQAHLFERGLAAAPPPPPRGPAEIVSGAAVSRPELERVFRSYQGATLDRADGDALADEHAAFAEFFETESAPEAAVTELWRVALVAGRPTGLVVVKPNEPEDGSRTGWILSLGVEPGARGRGIGKALLGAGLAVLAAHEVDLALALIDDVNAPSIAVHRSAGFAPQPERYLVYRRPLRAALTPPR